MTKTFTPTNFKTDSNNRNLEEVDNSEERFYRTIKSKLDALERNPSEDTISKILNHAKKR
jgi:ribosomal protein L18E